MQKKAFVFILSLIILFAAGCAKIETDVALARRIFNGLAGGNQRVENLIDWEHFLAVDIDVGKAYSNIISEKERKDYRKAFFYNLSFSFRASRADVSMLSNWRIFSIQPDKSIVAADAKSGKTILLTLSNISGRRKLSRIEWLKEQ